MSKCAQCHYNAATWGTRTKGQCRCVARGSAPSQQPRSCILVVLCTLVENKNVCDPLAVTYFSPKPTHPIQKKPIRKDRNPKVVLCVFSVFEGLWCVFCFHFFLRKCVWLRIAETSWSEQLDRPFPFLFLSLLPS